MFLFLTRHQLAGCGCVADDDVIEKSEHFADGVQYPSARTRRDIFHLELDRSDPRRREGDPQQISLQDDLYP